jgi:hypothetical protein
LVDTINTHREYVADILRTHGDLILNRWTKKKNKDKRAAILGTVDIFSTLRTFQGNEHDEETATVPGPFTVREINSWLGDLGGPCVYARWLRI